MRCTLPQITPQQLQRTWHISSWKRRPGPNGWDMILNMFVRAAHHRAQCDIYLRITGIKPPDDTTPLPDRPYRAFHRPF